MKYQCGARQDIKKSGGILMYDKPPVCADPAPYRAEDRLYTDHREVGFMKLPEYGVNGR